MRKSNLKFCIIFNMISFVNVQGSVKIRLPCSNVLLLTISSSNIVTHSNGHIKGDKYFFFYNSRCGKGKLNYLQSKVETQYRKIIFITPSNIKHFIERSSVTSIGKMGAIRIFSIWWFLFIFFIKWQHWCKVLCLINCNDEKIFFQFFWWKRV